jgi:hypothetical protein
VRWPKNVREPTARICYCVANMQVYTVVMTQREARIYSQAV